VVVATRSVDMAVRNLFVTGIAHRFDANIEFQRLTG
jgi:hypothetical protein